MLGIAVVSAAVLNDALVVFVSLFVYVLGDILMEDPLLVIFSYSMYEALDCEVSLLASFWFCMKLLFILSCSILDVSGFSHSPVLQSMNIK